MLGAMQHFKENPFHVLGLPPTVSRADAEREGQKLLGMLELGLHQAAQYVSPLGQHARTPELVRWALAELRDPDKRLQHEFWAQLPATEPTAEPAGEQVHTSNGVPGLRRALGWER